MPIYTYICEDCGMKFDILVGINQEKIDAVCPGCGSSSVEKRFSVFGISGSEKGSWCSSCSGGDCSTCGR